MKRWIIFSVTVLASLVAMSQRHAPTTGPTGWTAFEFMTSSPFTWVNFTAPGESQRFSFTYGTVAPQPFRYCFYLTFVPSSMESRCLRRDGSVVTDEELECDMASLNSAPIFSSVISPAAVAPVGIHYYSFRHMLPGSRINFYASEFYTDVMSRLRTDRPQSFLFFNNLGSLPNPNIRKQAWTSEWNGNEWVGRWEEWQVGGGGGLVTFSSPILSPEEQPLHRRAQSYRIFLEFGGIFGGWGSNNFCEGNDHFRDNSVIVHIHRLPIPDVIELLARPDGTLDSIVIPFAGPLESGDRVTQIQFAEDEASSPFKLDQIPPMTNLGPNNPIRVAVDDLRDSPGSIEDHPISITWQSRYINRGNPEEFILRIRRADTLRITERNTINPTCPNYSDGRINISFSGGRPFGNPLVNTAEKWYRVMLVKGNDTLRNFYHRINTAWNTTTELSLTFDALPAGVYKIIVMDRDSATYTITVELKDPTDTPQDRIFTERLPMRHFPYGDQDVKNWGRLTVSPNNSAHTYTWSGNGTVSGLNDTAFDPSGVGQVILTVEYRRNNGSVCILRDTVQISEPTTTLLRPEIGNLRQPFCESSETGILNTRNLQQNLSNHHFSWHNENWNTIIYGEQLNNRAPGYYRLCIHYRGIRSCTIQKLTANPLVITVTNTSNILCYGLTTGEITLSITGGSGNSNVIWDENSSLRQTQTTGLAAGNHRAFIRDSGDRNCIADLTITLTQPNAPLRIRDSIRHVDCYGDSTGQIILTVSGGAGNYSWTRHTGSLTKTSDTTFIFSNLPKGDHKFTVRDGNDCSIDDTSFTITQPDSLRISDRFSEQSRCYGDWSGHVGVAVSGGTLPYAFSWNDPEQTTDSIIKGIEQGTFRVTVTDGNNCQVSGEVTLKQRSRLGFTYEITQPQHGYYEYGTRHGEYPNGAILLRPYGGTGNRTFQINNDGWFSANGDTIITKLDTGIYIIQLEDSLGCTVIKSVQLTRIPALRATIHRVQHILCHDDTNGILRVEVIGGIAPYQIEWRLDGALLGTSDTLRSLGIGLYRISVRDESGTVSLDSFRLRQPDLLRINTISADSVTGWGSSTGKITANVSGGTTPFSFVWTHRETGIGSTTSTHTLIDIPTGWYDLTVIDSNFCIALAEVYVPTPDSLTHIYTVTHCTYFGSEDGTITPTKTDGKIAVTVRGGVKPYRFQWSKNGTLIQETLSPDSTDVLRDREGGIYTLLVIDRNGYYFRDTFEIIQRLPLVSWIEQIDIVSCNDEQDAMLSVSFKEGTPGYYRVTWQRFENNQWNIIRDTAFNEANTDFLKNIGAGNYRVIVRDSFAFTPSHDHFEVWQPDPLHIASEVQILTRVDVYDAWIEVTVSGGRRPYTYSWTRYGVAFSTDTILKNLSPGMYTFHVSDSMGCFATKTFLINEINDILISAEITHRSYRVANQGVLTTQDTMPDGRIELRITGGVAPYTIEWFFEGSPINITGPIATNLMQGNYQVRITDAANNVAMAGFYIHQKPPLIARIDSVVHVSCFGYADGFLRATVTGGIPPYTFTWNTPNLDATPIITGLGPRIFTVIVTDSMGRQSNYSIEIREPDALTVRVDQTDIRCWGERNGAFTLTPVGGNPPFLFSNDQQQIPRSTFTVTNLYPGYYQANIIDQRGCSQKVSVELTQPEPFYLTYTIRHSDHDGRTIDRNAQTINNGSIHLHPQGGSKPYSFRWLNATSTDSIRTGLAGGTYNVQLRDANGCLIEHAFVIQQAAPLQVSIRMVQDIYCYGQTGTLSVNYITGGVPPFRLLWCTGDTTDQIENLAAGAYILRVFDSMNVEASARFTLNQPPQKQIEIVSYRMPLCFGNRNGHISALVFGGRPPFRHIWCSGLSAPTKINASANTYTLTVTDANNCVAQISKVLTQPEPLSVIAEIKHPVCYGYADGAIALKPIGGTEPHDFLWLNHQQQNLTITDLRAGVFNLRLYDGNNCRKDTNFVLIDPPKLVIQNLAQSVILCAGQHHQPVPQPDTLNFQWWSLEFPFTSNEQSPKLHEGMYFVRAFNQHLCYANDSILVSLSPDTVVAQFWLNSDVFINEITTIVHVSYPVPDSALWVIPDNVEIVSYSFEYIQLVFHEEGEHVVGLIAYKGACVDYTETQVFANGERKEELLQNSPTLFDYAFVSPNPSRDYFELRLRTRQDADLLIQLFRANTAQQPVRTFRKNARAYQTEIETVSVQNLPPGTYVLTIQNNTHRQVLKLIIL